MVTVCGCVTVELTSIFCLSEKRFGSRFAALRASSCMTTFKPSTTPFGMSRPERAEP